MNLFELFVKIGVDDQASDKVSSLSSKLGQGLQTAAKVGTAAMAAIGTATVAAGTAFSNNIKQTAEYADNIDKMSQKIGISAQAYQEWDFIMQHSGASVDSLQMGVKTLSQKMEKAAEVIQKTTQADSELEEQLVNGTITLEEYNQKYDDLYDSAYKDIDAFTKLGYSMLELESFESTEELLSDVITRLQGMEEGAERTALASELLGRSGVELGALFNTSAEDVEAMRQQVHDLGGVMSNEAVKAGAAYQDSLQNLGVSVDSLGRNLSSKFLPSVTSMMDGLSALITGDESGFALIETGINDFIDNLANELPKFLELGTKIVENLATAVLDNLPKLFESGVSIITELLTSAVGMLPQIIALGLDLIVSLANGIADSLPTLIPTIMDVILQIVDTLTDPKNLSNLLQAALSIITQLAWGLVNSIPALIDSVMTLIENIIIFLVDPANLAMLVQAAIELVVALGLGLIEALPKLYTSLAEMVTSIFAYFADYDWGQLGKDLVAGFKKGIQNAWYNLKTWFKSLFGDLIGIAKKILGIASPSKVFKKLGGFTADGFGIGFEDEFAHVKSEVEDALKFDDVSVGINASVRKIGSGNSGTLYGVSNGGVTVVQNIYSQAKTAADLMQEAIYQQERAVMLGV